MSNQGMLETRKEMDSTRYNAVSRRIYKAIINDDWDSVSRIFEADKERLNSSISSYGDTPLLMAVGTNSSHRFVKKLVKQIMTVGGGVEMLRTPNMANCRYNALHLAAKRGNCIDAKLLVRNDPRMPQTVADHGKITPLAFADMPHTVAGHGKITPLALAAWKGDKETVSFLLSVTRDEVLIGEDASTSPFRGFPGACMLRSIIIAGFYDVALYLVHTYPSLVAEKSYVGETALGVLAARENAFPSGCRLRFLERIIYSRISIDPDKTFYYAPIRGQDYIVVDVDIEDGRKPGPANYLQRYSGKGSLIYLVPYMKHLHAIKLRHVQAKQLLRQILSVLLELEDNISREIIGHAIHIAVRHGNHELVEECIWNHPELIMYEVNRLNLFKAAIVYRQEKVFNFMYQMSAHRTIVLGVIDDENALHLVGKLAPYDRLRTVTGVALQMQLELLWFKEVEKFIAPAQRDALNKDGKTPRMVFTNNHEQLLLDAQQWTQRTSSSSTVAASLLVTIAFAAMFTVPGGNSNDGKSIFLKDPVFLLFVISDAIALFSSSTSVLMFLSTLTHSSQDDFLYALPLRLTLGLISLFISLATTMITFSTTLVLVLRDEIRWIAVPVTLMASVPAFLFLWLQYPLLHELIGATFGKSIFRKQSNVLLH